MKTYFKIFIISVVISLSISMFFAHGKFIDTLIINVIYAGIFSSANYFYFKWIGKIMDWKNKTKKTFFTGLAGMIPLNIIALFFVQFLVLVIYFNNTFSEFIQAQNVKLYFLTLLIAFVISLFMINLHFINRFNPKSSSKSDC